MYFIKALIALTAAATLGSAAPVATRTLFTMLAAYAFLEY
jgi:hypothetical protein